MDDFGKRVEQGKKEALKKGKLRTAFKNLRIRDFAPMLYLKETVVDSEGNKIESYATDPIQVDRIAREAWDNIYAGIVKDYKQIE